MRINQADRAFWSIVALAAGVTAGAWAVLCCGAWALGSEIAANGPSVLAKPRLFPAIALVLFLVAALVMTGWSIWTQTRATRRLAAYFDAHRVPLGAVVEEESRRAGLAGRVVVVDSTEPFSCTYGVRRPLVAVSVAMVESSSSEELAAVLAHEAHHVRAGDPRKVVVARGLARGLFALPALTGLYERYLAGRELAADRRAIGVAGVPSLAGALLRATAGPAELEIGAAAALGGDRALELRLEQLESGDEPALGPLDRRALYVSGVAALVLGGGMASASLALGPFISRFCHCR